jgi:hypothetical protein
MFWGKGKSPELLFFLPFYNQVPVVTGWQISVVIAIKIHASGFIGKRMCYIFKIKTQPLQFIPVCFCCFFSVG